MNLGEGVLTGGTTLRNARKSEVRKDFEAKLAEYIGVKYAIGTSLGRTALLVLLKAIGLEKGNEVIMPAYICEVVSNAVLKSGGIPIFVDTNPDDYHISIHHLKSLLSERVRAVIINHTFGYPEDIDRIKDVVGDKPIYLIEDVSQALGAKYKGKRVGSLSDVACFSFTKNTFNIGGGAITTNDSSIASNVRGLLADAKTASFLTHLFIGSMSFLETRRVHSSFSNSFFNTLDFFSKKPGVLTKRYHNTLKIPDSLAISDREARLAISQLAKLDSLNEKRRHNRDILDNLLKDGTAIEILGLSSEFSEPVCSWYAIRLRIPSLRDKVIKMLGRKHVFLYKFWDTIPLEGIRYNNKQSLADVPNAVQNANSTLVFKMDPNLSEKQLVNIGNALLSVQ